MNEPLQAATRAQRPAECVVLRKNNALMIRNRKFMLVCRRHRGWHQMMINDVFANEAISAFRSFVAHSFFCFQIGE